MRFLPVWGRQVHAQEREEGGDARAAGPGAKVNPSRMFKVNPSHMLKRLCRGFASTP